MRNIVLTRLLQADWRASRARGRHAVSVLHSGQRISGTEQLHLHKLRSVHSDHFGEVSDLRRQSLLCRRDRRSLPLALTILAIGALSAAAPVRAQSYDPNWFACTSMAGGASHYECRHTSLAQCNATASGRAAQCDFNPYYAAAEYPAPVGHHRRNRRHSY